MSSIGDRCRISGPSSVISIETDIHDPLSLPLSLSRGQLLLNLGFQRFRRFQSLVFVKCD